MKLGQSMLHPSSLRRSYGKLYQDAQAAWALALKLDPPAQYVYQAASDCQPQLVHVGSHLGRGFYIDRLENARKVFSRFAFIFDADAKMCGRVAFDADAHRALFRRAAD